MNPEVHSVVNIIPANLCAFDLRPAHSEDQFLTCGRNICKIAALIDKSSTTKQKQRHTDHMVNTSSISSDLCLHCHYLSSPLSLPIRPFFYCVIFPPFNPLSPNIHIQILQTDLYIFP